MCICIHSVSVRLDCEDLVKKSNKNLSIFIDLYGSVSRDLTGKFSYPDNNPQHSISGEQILVEILALYYE